MQVHVKITRLFAKSIRAFMHVVISYPTSMSMRFSVFFLCLAVASAAASPSFTTSSLRCDGSNFGESHSPSTNFAIDNPRPTFTWANEHTRRGERQTAFELVLREHRRGGGSAMAFEQMPLIWSSGRIMSSEPSLTYPSHAPGSARLPHHA